MGTITPSTRRALTKLGQDLRGARLRRRISTAILAERASISRTTLNKIENGNPGVALGHYATVLFALGFIARLADLAEPQQDPIGRDLDEERLPKRIRQPKARKK